VLSTRHFDSSSVYTPAHAGLVASEEIRAIEMIRAGTGVTPRNRASGTLFWLERKEIL
jgi:hypothetical protein